MQALPLSVIIVNHNAGPLLSECVRAVQGQAVREVIVVDNGSTDGSLELLRERADPAALGIVETGRNLGFAAACNIGLRAATQPFLLFLNPDGIPAPGSLARLLQVLEQHPAAGMVGGLLLNPDGTEQRGGRRAIPTPGQVLMRRKFNLHGTPLPSQPTPVEAISGALMLVRREAMQAVGPWDEGYFLHCEDLDWCLRFRQKGWDILFVPDAPVVHYQGTCSRARPLFVEWHKHRGMLRFYRKFSSQPSSGLLMGLVALGVWLRFGLVVLRHAVRRTLHWGQHD